MKTKTIKQVIAIKKTPHEVYEILMDSKKHSLLTGSKAKISRKVGGKFSVYDGGLYGINLSLVKDKKIVQSWRISEWEPKTYYSRLAITLGRTKKGTKLEMTHSGVPDYDYKETKEGWKEFYWEPLKEMVT